MCRLRRTVHRVYLASSVPPFHPPSLSLSCLQSLLTSCRFDKFLFTSRPSYPPCSLTPSLLLSSHILPIFRIVFLTTLLTSAVILFVLLLASCCWPASFSPVCYLTLVPPLDVFPLPLSSLHSPSPSLSLSLDFSSCSILLRLLLRGCSIGISLHLPILICFSGYFVPLLSSLYMYISVFSDRVVDHIPPVILFLCPGHRYVFERLHTEAIRFRGHSGG